MNSVKSSHEIIRELMFQLSNSLEKVIIDIEEYTNDLSKYKNTSKKEVALKKIKKHEQVFKYYIWITNLPRF